MPGSHYFDEVPSTPSKPGTVRIDLADLSMDVATDVGVFSRSRLDEGTRILLENAPSPRTSGPILDLGCGYGPITLTWAARRKRTEVWATDVNRRALELTRLNAESANLKNVRTAHPDEFPADVSFGAVYSNPPIRVGKDVLHGMLRRWLGRLLPGGSAFLVVQRNLGADSLAKWLNAEGYPTDRLTSVKGFRILEARPRPGGPVTGVGADATADRGLDEGLGTS